MAKKNFYVVNAGRTPGIYKFWWHKNDSLCAKAQVHQFPGAVYQGFSTKEEALNFYTGNTAVLTPDVIQSSTESTPVTRLSISTDAACSGNPGPMEYRGVWTETGEVIFESPVYEGTNNIGEFLALVTAIRYARENNLQCEVYTDSITAMSWVRNKQAKTSFDLSTQPELLRIMNEALEYLQTHDFYARVVKWDTKTQGEIKADYNRK